MCFLEGFAVNGIANAGLPAIEKHFGISSTKSSVVASSQDFGALAVVLFVSFIGARLHKPRIVALGSVIMGIGSFLFIVPHMAEEYDLEGLSLCVCVYLCSVGIYMGYEIQLSSKV